MIRFRIWVSRLVVLLILAVLPPSSLLFSSMLKPDYWTQFPPEYNFRIFILILYILFWLGDYTGFVLLLVKWFRELIHPVF